METSSHFPDSFYRVAVKGLCVRDGRVLLAHDPSCVRNGEPVALWELPGGGMDFGETFADTLAREVKEEMGLTVTKMAAKPMYLWTNKNYSRRQMDWYYTLILAFPFEVQNLVFTPTGECDEIRFCTKEEVQMLDLNDQLGPFRSMFDPKDFV